MSRFQDFVKGNQQQQAQSFPQPQQIRHDRIQAQSLKIAPGTAKSAHKPAGAAPISASTTTSNRFVTRTSYGPQQQPFANGSVYQAPTQEPPQNSQYNDHIQKSPRGLRDDETIHSDFDKTISGSEFQDNQPYAENEDEYDHDNEGGQQLRFQQGDQGQQPYGYGQEVEYGRYAPHDTRGDQELKRLPQEQNNASKTVVLSSRSRFAESQLASQHSALPNRAQSANASTEYDSRSRKRTRSAENQQFDDGYHHEPAGQLGDSQSEVNESSQSSSVPIQRQARGSRRAHQSQQYDEEGSLSQTPYEHLPDYDDAQLRLKKYSDLVNESREYDPGQTGLILPKELQGAQVPLGQKVDYYVQSFAGSQDTERGEHADDSRLFFAQLSTRDWDEAGDIFVDKFADLMKQIKAKRAQKREAMDKFEKEIEKREKAVRGKSENLDHKFEGMRASGEHVLSEKKS